MEQDYAQRDVASVENSVAVVVVVAEEDSSHSVDVVVHRGVGCSSSVARRHIPDPVEGNPAVGDSLEEGNPVDRAADWDHSCRAGGLGSPAGD